MTGSRASATIKSQKTRTFEKFLCCVTQPTIVSEAELKFQQLIVTQQKHTRVVALQEMFLGHRNSFPFWSHASECKFPLSITQNSCRDPMCNMKKLYTRISTFPLRTFNLFGLMLVPEFFPVREFFLQWNVFVSPISLPTTEN